MNANYLIAEIPIYMNPRFSPLTERSRAYRTKESVPALMDLTLPDNVYQDYHRRFPEARDSLIEYMATGAGFYAGILMHQGLLLHASAVVVDGFAYLFSASSGVGKSTHTSLWLEEFPNAFILNDDKPAIRILPDGIFAYGTPWSGKSDLNRNCKVPLKGIAFIERSDHNEMTPLPAKNILLPFMEQTVRPKDPNLAPLMLDHIDTIIQRVPIYRLYCLPNRDAARLAYSVMKEGFVK